MENFLETFRRKSLVFFGKKRKINEIEMIYFFCLISGKGKICGIEKLEIRK